MIWYVATLIASVCSTGGSAQGSLLEAEPQFVTAEAGEEAVLGCQVAPPLNGRPYVVEWFKYGASVPFFINFRFYPPHVDPQYQGRASLQGKSSLRIEQLRSDDQGWYECKVLMLEQQYDTFHNGSWVHLTVNAPPTFSETPPQYLEANEGSSLTLTCSAIGHPKPSVSWLRESHLLVSSGKYKVSDGSVTVFSVSREDRGSYTCRAVSPRGEVLHTTRLLVQGPPFIVSPPVNTTVNVSQDVFFSCQAEAFPRNLTYSWFWEDLNVFFKNDLKRRVSILIDGSLIIAQVKPEDSGKYTCVPSNSLAPPPSASAHLTVQYPARVLNMPSAILAAVGLPGFIRCPVDANPPVTMVMWKKDGLPLRIDKYPGWSQMEDGSIRVAEVTEDSLGTYTCMPYNALGTMGWSPPAPLVLKDPPKFSVVPGGEYRQEAGRELLIPCEAEGDPAPNVTWRKVGPPPSTTQHSVLPRGSLRLQSLSKDDHGFWECVASNMAASVTASTHIQVTGTSPHPPSSVRVVPSSTRANVSWESGYDGGFPQTFSIWMKRERLGPHDWRSVPVPGGQEWAELPGLEPDTSYQFSILAHNKLGSAPFSQVVTVKTPVSPLSSEPAVLLTPPRCLTANRTAQGVLLSWMPPTNHTAPLQHYTVELRLQLAGRWEVLDGAVPPAETELLARDLIQESWYEFRVTAVMDDIISEPSNVVGVASTDFFPPPEPVGGRGLARPVVAGVVATICFLSAAILFSTMAACWVNKQRRRKLKRKPDPPLSITHCRKSLETPSSSGKASPESAVGSEAASPPSETSGESHDDEHGKKKPPPPPSPARKEELSLYKKTKRAIITSRKYKQEADEATPTPIELISRGPDGRFVVDGETSVKPPRRIEGFPFVEESDLYPDFRQSDEENDDDPRSLPPPPPPPVPRLLRPRHHISSPSWESYPQPPAYSPRLHGPFEGVTVRAAGQIRGSLLHQRHRAFYGYLGPPGDHHDDAPPPFYMADSSSPLSSVVSSPPYLAAEGPFGHAVIPEEFPQYGFPLLPLTVTSSSPRPPEFWPGGLDLDLDFTWAGLEGPRFVFPPLPHHLRQDSSPYPPPPPPPPRVLPLLGAFQLPPPLPMPTYPALPPEAPPKRKSPGKAPPQCSPARHRAAQEAQLRHAMPVLPYAADPMAHVLPGAYGGLDTPWFQFSPRQVGRLDPALQQVVLQPSRLSPLTQSPLSSHRGSPDNLARPRPRPSLVQASLVPPAERSEITLLPPSAASFSRRSSPSPSSSPTLGQGSRRASPGYRRSHVASSYPASHSPSPPAESSGDTRRTEEGTLSASGYLGSLVVTRSSTPQ